MRAGPPAVAPSPPTALRAPGHADGLRVAMLDTLSGTNDYTVELVQALCDLAPLTVFTVQGSRLAPRAGLDLRMPFPAFAAPRTAAWKAWRTLCGYWLLVAWVLQAPQRTVVHVQFLRHERTEALLLGLLQRAGARIVCTAHNALPHVRKPWHYGFYRRWYRQADAVQVLSEAVGREIEQALPAPLARLQRIGHGPYGGLQRRFAGLARETARQALGWDLQRFVVLQFGLFKPYKGLSRLAEAVAGLPQDLRPLVALAGGGPAQHLQAVRQQFARSGRADDVWWHDRFADDATLCRMIVAADVVVFPYDSVSQSGALVLALSLGKPCLCSDLAGFREVLTEASAAPEAGQTSPLPRSPALVVSPDPQAWALALAGLMTDPKRLQALQLVAHQAAQRLPTWGDIAAQTWRLWHEVRAGVPPSLRAC